ncbi:hypothetical protein [Candidatus Cyrtobacter comes]|uniref:hypothetical protein n=1 Tax=Candidatus Cyrtobacter comes TaxID=675776 RepID=UPI002ACEEE66|nr:hypothetical protein [Candidatus Cyrtobacter comes]
MIRSLLKVGFIEIFAVYEIFIEYAKLRNGCSFNCLYLSVFLGKLSRSFYLFSAILSLIVVLFEIDSA